MVQTLCNNVLGTLVANRRELTSKKYFFEIKSREFLISALSFWQLTFCEKITIFQQLLLRVHTYLNNNKLDTLRLLNFGTLFRTIHTYNSLLNNRSSSLYIIFVIVLFSIFLSSYCSFLLHCFTIFIQ